MKQEDRYVAFENGEMYVVHHFVGSVFNRCCIRSDSGVVMYEHRAAESVGRVLHGVWVV